MTEFQPSDLRIGDAERESAMTALGEHMSAGRINLDEYGERSAQITTAKTRGELLALFTDLPQPHPDLTGAPQPAPAATTSGFPSAAPFPQSDMAGQPPRVPQRPGWVRALPVLLPAIAVVAIGLIVVTHFWIFILLPLLFMIAGRAAGFNDRRDYYRQRDLERRAARERWRNDRHNFKHELRRQMRDVRRNSRGW